jgi:hypothetical protein
MIPKVDTGFRKRSCSKHRIERDDDSKKSHLARGGVADGGQALRASAAAAARPRERLNIGQQRGAVLQSIS